MSHLQSMSTSSTEHTVEELMVMIKQLSKKDIPKLQFAISEWALLKAELKEEKKATLKSDWTNFVKIHCAKKGWPAYLRKSAALSGAKDDNGKALMVEEQPKSVRITEDGRRINVYEGTTKGFNGSHASTLANMFWNPSTSEGTNQEIYQEFLEAHPEWAEEKKVKAKGKAKGKGKAKVIMEADPTPMKPHSAVAAIAAVSGVKKVAVASAVVEKKKPVKKQPEPVKEKEEEEEEDGGAFDSEDEEDI
jgi:hypothetical protein